ncbi:MAG: LemA family protein [Hyphomicrobiaceae bacterium]
MSISTVGLIILGGIALIVLWLIGVYNGLVGLRQRCSQAFADIDVQLTQRHELIPNLVETVKGYAKHERETLESVIKARTAAMTAEGPGAQSAAEGRLTGAISRLMLLVENYPEIKANENFRQLQTALSGIENKIAAARRFFNNAAAEYNTIRQTFPAVLVANSLGFKHQDFYAIAEEERDVVSRAPEVKF